MKRTISLAAALSLLATATFAAAPPTLRNPAALAKGVEAFPRLEGGTPAARAINQALDKADAQVAAEAKDCVADSDGKGHWTRKVDVTLKSARFLSFVAHDDYYCGGPYPDTNVTALVYDLGTGALVDWKQLLPAVTAQSAEPVEDGPPLATVTAPDLLGLFKDASGKTAASKSDDDDADCSDALTADPTEPTQLLIWPDAKARGLVLTIPGLPHVVRACGGPLTIPAAKLKAMHADAALVEDIESTPAGDENGRKRL